MQIKQPITHTVIIFTGLGIAGFGLAFGAQVIPNAFAQTLMISLGSAVFGAGLTFFLIRMSKLDKHH